MGNHVMSFFVIKCGITWGTCKATPKDNHTRTTFTRSNCPLVLLCKSKSSWSSDFSRLLRSCDTGTLGSPIAPGSSKGLSTGVLGLVTPNVKDGVYCLSLGNYVPGESEAFPNVDINVFSLK
jgi:hypothetical protein